MTAPQRGRLTADDKLGVQALILRFLMAADAGDARSAAAAFVPDGVLVLDSGDAAGSPMTLVGRQPIETWGATYLAHTNGTRIRHVPSNFIVSAGEDGAHVRLLIQNLDVVTGPTLVSIGVGIGHAVADGPEWRLKRWEYRPDPTRP
jgi:hypothetical protein